MRTDHGSYFVTMYKITKLHKERNKKKREEKDERRKQKEKKTNIKE